MVDTNPFDYLATAAQGALGALTQKAQGAAQEGSADLQKLVNDAVAKLPHEEHHDDHANVGPHSFAPRIPIVPVKPALNVRDVVPYVGMGAAVIGLAITLLRR